MVLESLGPCPAPNPAPSFSALFPPSGHSPCLCNLFLPLRVVPPPTPPPPVPHPRDTTPSGEALHTSPLSLHCPGAKQGNSGPCPSLGVGGESVGDCFLPSKPPTVPQTCMALFSQLPLPFPTAHLPHIHSQRNVPPDPLGSPIPSSLPTPFMGLMHQPLNINHSCCCCFRPVETQRTRELPCPL